MKNKEDYTSPLKILEEHKAIITGSFILSSGKVSDTYVQLNTLMKKPQDLSLLCTMLAEKITEQINVSEIDIILSPAIGAIIIGYEIAKILNKEYIFTERDKNNKMTLRRGFALQPQQKVLIIENVITTGRTIKELMEIITENNSCLIGMGSIIDRTKNSLNIEDKPLISLVQLFTKEYEMDQLPDDLKKITPQKPGSR